VAAHPLLLQRRHGLLRLLFFSVIVGILALVTKSVVLALESIVFSVTKSVVLALKAIVFRFVWSRRRPFQRDAHECSVKWHGASSSNNGYGTVAMGNTDIIIVCHYCASQ
jgi:hypothetical protein